MEVVIGRGRGRGGGEEVVRFLSRKGLLFRLWSLSLNWLCLRRVFDLLDKNGDGVIMVDEISKVFIFFGFYFD